MLEILVMLIDKVNMFTVNNKLIDNGFHHERAGRVDDIFDDIRQTVSR